MIMKYHVTTITFSQQCPHKFRCDECVTYPIIGPIFQMWSADFRWWGLRCSGCVRGMDVVYDCYLEYTHVCGDVVVYNDMALVTAVHPTLVPKLTKI